MGGGVGLEMASAEELGFVLFVFFTFFWFGLPSPPFFLFRGSCALLVWRMPPSDLPLLVLKRRCVRGTAQTLTEAISCVGDPRTIQRRCG